jgi:hypothetical protein
LLAVVVAFMGVAWQSPEHDGHTECGKTKSHVNFLRG